MIGLCQAIVIIFNTSMFLVCGVIFNTTHVYRVSVMGNFDKVVGAGKSFACSVYKAQPGALIPNPISEFLRLSWDSFCGDDSPSMLPPPPAPPFVGGQCPVFYEVTFQITDPRDPSRPSQKVQLKGDIAGAEARYTTLSPSSFGFSLGILARDNSGRRIFSQQAGGNESTEAAQKQWKIRVVSVVRLDGQPDNCGSLPATYPVAPLPPTGGYTSSPTTITYNDNSNFVVVFNFTPPLDNTTTPPEICLTVRVGSKQFEVCYPFGGKPYLPAGGDVDELIRELQNELRDFREQYDRDTHPLSPEDDPSLTPRPLPGDEGGEDDAPNIKWLLVTLTTVSTKAQFGSPTVYFAGWVTFRVNGAYTERQQISYEKSLFRAPEGADGYGVTFTNFSKGNVVSYTTQQS